MVERPNYSWFIRALHGCKYITEGLNGYFYFYYSRTLVFVPQLGRIAYYLHKYIDILNIET